MGRRKKNDIEREKQEKTHTIEAGQKESVLPKEDTTEQIKSIVEEYKEESGKEFEVIDSIDFYNGKNKLSIRLSKKILNRGYRIQIFLNDENEIRSSTYNGQGPANSFWKLLKGSIKN